MKVISISTDRKIFQDGSPVQTRSLEYAKKMEEFHVVVFTLAKEGHTLRKINNLYLYPTNSLSKLSYVISGKKIATQMILNNKFKIGESVISTQDPFQTGLVGLYLKKKFNFPLQIQIHTDFLSKHFSGFLNNIRKRMARKTIPKADGIRVVSTVIADSLKQKFKHLKTKIDILPVFVDAEKIAHEPIKRNIQKDFPQFKFIIFMASRLSKEKKFDVALQSLKKVVKDYPYAGLVIAGSGPEEGRIKELAKRLGLRKNVVLIGWQDDLTSYYKTCNVFLVTSEYEGYGMTLIEAGASGAVIVTTKVGVAKTDLFVDEANSHVCPVGDYNCVASCILSIIRDNEKRVLFSHTIQEAVLKSSSSKELYFSQYVDLLQNLLLKRNDIMG